MQHYSLQSYCQCLEEQCHEHTSYERNFSLLESHCFGTEGSQEAAETHVNVLKARRIEHSKNESKQNDQNMEVTIESFSTI